MACSIVLSHFTCSHFKVGEIISLTWKFLHLLIAVFFRKSFMIVALMLELQFTVHEKSILLPLLPATLLAVEEPFLVNWITPYALFSMFPLLCRDQLILPYIALSTLFMLINHAPNGRREGEVNSLKSLVTAFFLFCALVLHIVYLTMQAPPRYPFLYEALIMLICFSQFVLLTVYTNAKQWMLLKGSHPLAKQKKLL